MINQLSANELSSHPYISWKQAVWIEKYRKQHGPYQNPEALLEIRNLDSAFIEKIKPYFAFGEKAGEPNDLSSANEPQ